MLCSWNGVPEMQGVVVVAVLCDIRSYTSLSGRHSSATPIGAAFCAYLGDILSIY